MSRQLGSATRLRLPKSVAASRIAPDVIHGHGAKGGAYAQLLPRARRVVLYTPHGGTLHYSWRSPVGALFSAGRLLMARTDGICSNHNTASVSTPPRAPPVARRVVFNGLSCSGFRAAQAADPIYDAVFVGELRTLKDISTLIEAASSIARDREFAAIAGTGPDESEIQAEVAAHGRAQRGFSGHRRARELRHGAHHRCSFARRSFPMLYSKPWPGRLVIATDVGGIPEIFGSMPALSCRRAMRSPSPTPSAATIKLALL